MTVELSNTPPPAKRTQSVSPLRVGYLPLIDAAPLIVAEALGLFKSRGLQVRLQREVGWATVRDKIIFRELDASHAVAPMVFATTLGLGCRPTPCLTACVLNSNGDAITLSSELAKRDVRDGEGLRREILRIRHERQLVLGVVFGLSSQNILLRDWLKASSIDPDRDVRIVVVPPPQLHRNLAAGTLDGYCVGEPWNSLAVRERTGWIAGVSAAISPEHPEKVLIVREDFAVSRAEEHLALVSALKESAALCDQPDFRRELPKLLARREYLDVPAVVLAAPLIGPFQRGCDQSVLGTEGLIRFHDNDAGVPTERKARWLLDGLIRHNLLPKGLHIPADLPRRVFREDLHQAASLLVSTAR